MMIFVFVEQIIHDLKNKLESFKDYNRNKFGLFLQALKKQDFYSSKLFLKLSLTFVIFLSIWIRSRMDLGPKTALAFDFAWNSFLKQNQDQELSSSISPLIINFIYFIPCFIANLLSISLTIIAPIFLVILEIISLLTFKKILKKTIIKKERLLYNSLVIGAALVIFLPIFNLEYNEFGTEPSILILLALPYFCIYLPKAKDNQKQLASESIIKGFFIASIIALKPLYILIVLLMENIFFGRDLKKSLRNFLSQSASHLAILLYLSFLVSLLFFKPEIAKSLANEKINWQNIEQLFLGINHTAITTIIMVLCLIILVLVSIGKINDINKIFVNFLIAVTMTFFINSKTDQQNLSTLFSFYILILINFFYEISKNHLINWKLPIFNWFLAAFAVIAVFDKTTYDFLIGSLALWPLLIWPFLLPILRNTSISRIFKILLCTILIVALIPTIWLKNYPTICLGSLIIAVLALVNKIIDKKCQSIEKTGNFFSKPLTVLIIITGFYFIQLTIHNIISAYRMDNYYKSPNQFSEEAYKIINNYGANQKIAIISRLDNADYPMAFYTNIKQYQFQKIWQKENKLIFIDNNQLSNIGDKSCHISLLEYYLQDKEFRQEFTKNYHFLRRIVVTKEVISKKAPFGSKEDEKYKSILADQQYLYDFDVYIKK